MADPTATRVNSITVHEDGETTTVRLLGEIDVALRAGASHAISQILDRRLPVVLDTSGVTFIDLTGIAFLIQCARASHEQGLSVTLPRPPPEVVEVLQMLGADGLFVSATAAVADSAVGSARPTLSGDASRATRSPDPRA